MELGPEFVNLQDLVQALMQRCLLHLPQIKLLACVAAILFPAFYTQSSASLSRNNRRHYQLFAPKKKMEKKKPWFSYCAHLVQGKHKIFMVTFSPWFSPFFILL